MSLEFSNFATALNKTKTIEETWQLGLNYFAKHDVNHVNIVSHSKDQKVLYRWSAPDWVSKAFEETLDPAKEPLIIHCKHKVSPFFVGKSFEIRNGTCTPEREQFISYLSQVGIENGVAFPIKAPSRQQWGFIGLGSKLNQRNFTQILKERGAILGLAGQAFYNRMESLTFANEQSDPNLSNREKECLLWLSKGLRSNQIATKMGIKLVTVEFHFKNSRKKLGAITREQALAKAIMERHIEP